MGESTVRTKSKSKSRAQHTSSNSGSATHHSRNLSSFYSAGPALSLIQKKAAIGRAGDSYEREADAVSKRVAAAQPAPQISRMPAGGIGREEIKKPEETAKSIQKQEIKKPEEAAKPVQREEIKKSEEPAKSIQKQEIKKPEEAAKPVQREEIKKPEEATKTVQKEEVKKPEETAKTIQKEEIKKPEEAAKPVQRQETKEPEDAAVQKQEDEVAQAKEGAGGAASPSMESAASHAISTKGPGQPLSPSTQGALESHMGADFSDVRVHNDSASQDAAAALNARAFTHRNDIWLGKGESQDDLRLMAHEATHVVQQSGRMQQMVRRAKGPVGAGKKFDPAKTGEVVKGKFIKVPEIKLPTFKVSSKRHKGLHPSPLVVPPGKEAPGKTKEGERDTKQVQNWKDAVAKGGGDDKVKKKVEAHKDRAVESGTSGQEIYFLKSKNYKFYLFGTISGLQAEARLPYWDRDGKERLMEVDHKKEIQLGGEDVPENYELLDHDANWSSGMAIRKETTKRINDAITPYTGRNADDYGLEKIWPTPPKLDNVIKNYEINYNVVRPGLSLEHGNPEPNQYWELEDVNKGSHLDLLDVMTPKQIRQAKLMGTESELVIYTSSRGGTPRRIPWDEDKGAKQSVEKDDFYKGFNLKQVHFERKEGEDAQIGEITGVLFKKGKEIKQAEVEWPIRRAPGIKYGGYIDDRSILNSINKNLELYSLSPIRFNTARLDDTKGLYAVGQVMPTVPLFANLGIDIVLEGNDVRLRKLFTAGEFSFPGPIRVTGSNLELSLGSGSGLGIAGEVQFEIERVGQGKLGAGAKTGTKSSQGGFEIWGEFIFDKNLFEDAKVVAWYKSSGETYDFGVEGRLTIKENKVKGIKSATFTVSYKDRRFEATGKLKPSISWIEEGDIVLSYSEAEGLAIGASLQFKKGVMRIKSGTLGAKVQKKPGEEKYRLSAHGKAEFDIPNVDAVLDVTYDEGAFDASVTAAYKKGMLKGSVYIGATNRPVSKDGQPEGIPDERSDKITIYGSGKATVRLAKWLEGTVGIKLLPNGEVELLGSVGLPEALNLFDPKKVEKNLISIDFDIPIVGFSVLGQRIGIFATVGGGVDFKAGIGPGQLKDLKLTVTYNPSHEEQTHVIGGASLFVPAYAEVRLYIHGALGAGIPIVSATLGLEIGGSLGIEGSISSGVQVDWSPAKGLVLDAEVKASAEPKFKFDITGFARVTADIGIKTLKLYNKEWKLLSLEYGSGLRLGIRVPVHYEEGKPFDFSLDKIAYEVPHIDPMEMIKGLVKRVV